MIIYLYKHINMINTFEDIKGKSINDKIIFLSKCNCCDDHKLNKPIKFINWVELPLNFNKKNKKCKCKCRQFARELCR